MEEKKWLSSAQNRIIAIIAIITLLIGVGFGGWYFAMPQTPMVKLVFNEPIVFEYKQDIPEDLQAIIIDSEKSTIPKDAEIKFETLNVDIATFGYQNNALTHELTKEDGTLYPYDEVKKDKAKMLHLIHGKDQPKTMYFHLGKGTVNSGDKVIAVFEFEYFVIDSVNPIITGVQDMETKHNTPIDFKPLFKATDSDSTALEVEVVGDIRYGTAGVYEMIARAYDNAGNATELPFKVTVKEEN